MSSCVNQVYDTPNAKFQASVTIPSRYGGEILGGYDVSLNQLIFAYENICYPRVVTDVGEGWSYDSSYYDNKNKTALDDNCDGTSTSAPVLLFPTPSAYKIFTIKQITTFVDPTTATPILVCGGTCTKSSTDGQYGFLFSWYLNSGTPSTILDGGFSNGSTPDGWFINDDSTPNNNTEINTIFGYNNNNIVVTEGYGISPCTIIYGGIKQEDIGGTYLTRPFLEKKKFGGDGIVTTTSILANDLTGYNDANTEITVVDITTIVNQGQGQGQNDNSYKCLVIYQIENDSNATQSVHIRELDIYGNEWKTLDFPLPEQSLNPQSPSTATGWASSNIKYTSSCAAANGTDVWYIAATGTLTGDAPGQYPMIYAIGYNANKTELELIQSFSNNRQESSFFNPEGVKIYIPDPPGLGEDQGSQGYNGVVADWKNKQIDNISYITKSDMNSFLTTSSGDDLFVTLSTIDSPQTKYISFVAALNSIQSQQPIGSTKSAPSGIVFFNNPDVNLLNAIISKDSPTQTNDSIKLTKDNQNLIQVELDSKLSGTLNDLQFKLAFCSSKLHLFAFGNYVNSPSSGSISSFALLNAISNICLSKGTQILCDQGIINIEKINTRKHTINNRTINHITQSIHTDDYLIKIKKNCFSSNSPSSDIICSGDHKILYKNNLIEAKNLINEVYGIEKIKNDKRVLYNILMDKHEVIMANNTPVESLHPQNIIAMFYNNYNNPQAREFLSDKIGQMNKYNHYITEANKTNSIHLRNGTSKKTSIPLRIGNKK
jgi:hypothetical protein